jgi:hypothetical protein
MLLSELTKEDIRKDPWNMFFFGDNDIIIFVYEVFTGRVYNDTTLKYIRIYDEKEDNPVLNDGAGNPEPFWIQKGTWTDNYELIEEEVKKEIIVNKRKLLIEKII